MRAGRPRSGRMDVKRWKVAAQACEAGDSMMNPKPIKISRRTLLKGIGVTLALPWLESLSGWGSEPASGTAPPAPPQRFAALFMGNGINPNHWWAKGSGPDMELSKSLEPLAPLRPRLNVV